MERAVTLTTYQTGHDLHGIYRETFAGSMAIIDRGQGRARKLVGQLGGTPRGTKAVVPR